MRILITGGSGLVGQNLTSRLVREGYTEIRVHINKRQPRIKHKTVVYVQGDLTNYETCLNVTKDIDVVIHAAANTSNAVDTVNDPLAHVTPNVVINNFLLDACYRNQVKKFLFISSSTVYPPKDELAVKENDFLFNEPYPVYYGVGWMKRFAEVQCRLYSEFIQNPMVTVIIRPANLYGPHDKFDFDKCHVTPATIRKVADDMNPIPIWGDGSELRDLLYIDDFIDALLIIIEKQNSYDIFNIGSNTVYSVLEILDIMKGLVKNSRPVEFIKGKPSMIPVRKISSDKFMEKFNWKPKTSINQGLMLTYEWYLENRSEFK